MDTIKEFVTTTEECVEKDVYKCEQCIKCFVSKDSLKKHKYQFHLEENKRTCNFCKHVFSTKDALNKHMKRQHMSDSPLIASFGKKT